MENTPLNIQPPPALISAQTRVRTDSKRLQMFYVQTVGRSASGQPCQRVACCRGHNGCMKDSKKLLPDERIKETKIQKDTKRQSSETKLEYIYSFKSARLYERLIRFPVVHQNSFCWKKRCLPNPNIPTMEASGGASARSA